MIDRKATSVEISILKHLQFSTSLPNLPRPSASPCLAATMRLTADLISSSLSYLNPLKERELDLRGTSEKN